MSSKSQRLILIAIWVVGVASILISIGTRVAREDSLSELPELLIVVTFGVIGSLIFARYPRHPVGWTFLAAFMFMSVEGLMGLATQLYASRFAVVPPRAAARLELIEAYRESLSAVVWLSLLTFPILYFPNGKLPSPGWRYFVRPLIALVIIQTLNPQLSSDFFPEGQSRTFDPLLGTLADITTTMLVLASVIAPITLILRFRRSTGIERQQIKWPLYSALLATIGIGGNLVVLFVVGGFGVGGERPGDALTQIGLALEALSVVTFPFTIGIGILRYRLFDIDLLINRTLVYGTLSALLALAYFGSVVVAQQVLPGDSPITVVLSTLAIVSLFSPLRRRIQSTIDKRFYRQRYDARRTVARLSEQLREDVDLEGVSEALLRAVGESIFPEHASLWLRVRGAGPGDQVVELEKHPDSGGKPPASQMIPNAAGGEGHES